MIAFVTFVKTFSIWIYIFSALGILFGIKMLFDARRLSRTTMFSLDQERAIETTSRGLLLIVVMAALIFAVTIVTVVIAPFVPQAEPPIARGVTPTVANIFPTTAPTPTATQVALKPTETILATGTPQPLPVWTLTFTPPPVRATAAVTTTSVLTSSLLPAPFPVYDKAKGDPVFKDVVVRGDGEATTRTALIFKWDWMCDQCILGPNDKFVVSVTFIDKFSGLPKSFGGSSTQKSLTMYDILRSYSDTGQFYQKAKDDLYQWYVQVKRAPNDSPISLPSETWKFTWH